MNFTIRIMVFLFGMLFIIGTIRLLLIKKIGERYSVFWLVGCLAILVLSIVPNLVDYIASFLRIGYPPTLLLLLSTLMLFWLCLYNSIHITLLKRRLVELTQRKAVEDALAEDEKQVNR